MSNSGIWSVMACCTVLAVAGLFIEKKSESIALQKFGVGLTQFSLGFLIAFGVRGIADKP